MSALERQAAYQIRRASHVIREKLRHGDYLGELLPTFVTSMIYRESQKEPEEVKIVACQAVSAEIREHVRELCDRYAELMDEAAMRLERKP